MFRIETIHEYKKEFFSDDLIKLALKTCTECNYPIIINLDKTIMKCSNKYCPEHMSHRAQNMFEILGIKGIGQKTAKKLIMTNNLKTHIDILGLTEDQIPISNPVVRKQVYYELQRGRKQTLPTIATLYQIDGISFKNCNKLFMMYSSFKSFFEDYPDLHSLIRLISNELSSGRATESSKKIAIAIFIQKEHMLKSEQYFEIEKINNLVFRVCITDNVFSVFSETHAFTPRKNFINFLNEKYEDITFILDNSATDVDVLLTDSTRNTNKRKTAVRNNIPIMSFSEFVKIIEKEYGKGKEYMEIKHREGF